jgi:phosphoserine aminotransferase
MRVYNFSAGPACMPLEVLERAAKEMTEHNGHGMSVMEMSHRSKMYEEIIQGTEASLRRLMEYRKLQGAFPAGRRVHAIRHGSA